MKQARFTINFLLKSTKTAADGQAPIYVRLTINGVRKEMATNLKVLPNYWNQKSGKVVNKDKFATEQNKRLDIIRLKLMEIYNAFTLQNIVPFPAEVFSIYLGRNITPKHSIFELFTEHNQRCIQLVNKSFAPGTIERYETSLKHTRDFVKLTYNQDDFYVEDINLKFIEDYEFYLKTERNCNHNTAVKYLKNFQKIVRIALKRGWISSDPFTRHSLKLEEVNRDFLEADELRIVYEKEICITRLDHIRDIFVFCCFTGLSFSDVKQLTKDHISTDNTGGKWLRVARQKTKNMCNIPLLEIPIQIIAKYDNYPECRIKGTLLPVPSNQKMNAYLLEIMLICGINKKVTTHTARHTFATTVTLSNGVSIESVAKMLGHSNTKMTRTYARVLDSKLKNEMEKIPLDFLG